MELTDKIVGAVRRRSSSCPNKWRLPVFVRITSLSLALALAGSVALGTPLHSSERGCNMSGMEMTDSDHMGMEPGLATVSSVPLCCLIHCQEPGPTGTAFTLKIPVFNGAFLQQIAPGPPLTLPKPLPQSHWVQTSSFSPPETYLKNLALLI